jgi:hypothetical protein
MKHAPKIALLSLVASMIAGQSFAASMKELQGAWITDGVDCAAVFEKHQGAIRFRDRSASTTTGIIISGSKVVGPQLGCTAEKIKSGKDHFSAYLNCGDAIMFSAMSVSFRVIDHNTFERFDETFPEASFRYRRCEL